MKYRILTAIGAITLFTVIGCFYLANAAPRSDIAITSAILGESHLNICKPLTVLLKNEGTNKENVNVLIELDNSANVPVDTYWTYLNFDPGQTLSAYNGCSVRLPAGNYTYSVSIYKAHGNKLLSKVENVSGFTVPVI